MGHTSLGRGAYQALTERLDRMPTGAPDSAVLQQILRALVTPEEAAFCAQVPTLVSVDDLARRTGRPLDDTEALVTSLAQRGMLIDLEHAGSRWVSLAPVVIGFYEFTFMRVRPETDQTRLAELFDQYLFEEGALARAVFAGSTQIGRSLVREEGLPDDPAVEILDWERATHLVATATDVAVSLCACRHHNEHLGKACDAPQRVCLSLNGGATALARSGLAEPIRHAEGLDILAQAKAEGLAQTGDNVQREVTYICNCCGCCCGMMQAVNHFGIDGAIVSSNWVAAVDHTACRGCGRCAKACPIDAVHLEDSAGQGLRRNWAVVDGDRCLGCGVCTGVCRRGALEMAPRAKRVHTPQSTVDRVVTMALERGKLGELLYDTLDGRGPHAVARVLTAIERTPLAEAARGVEPLRSAFLTVLLGAIHRTPQAAASP